MDSAAPRENILKDKSYAFALRVIKAYKYLAAENKEYVLSKQLLRSGTSIGANIAEANQAQSRPDFINKLSIALKETVETEYWLCLLRDASFITPQQAESLIAACLDLRKFLHRLLKRQNLTRNNSPFSILNSQLHYDNCHNRRPVGR